LVTTRVSRAATEPPLQFSTATGTSPAIISHAVWLYYRFTLSFRDVEDLLAHRGITVSYESIRHWCETFGLAFARRLRHRAWPVGDTWHLDELFVTIRGQRQYLWRAVDQDGDVIDILLQPRRDRRRCEGRKPATLKEPCCRARSATRG
jgi:transposase-like protein